LEGNYWTFILDDKATHKGTKSARFQGIMNSMCMIQSLKLEGRVNI